MKSNAFIAACGALQMVLAASLPATAQTPPVGIGDAVRQAEETRRTAPPTRPPAQAVLPRLVEPELTFNDKETLLVRRFAVEGLEGPNLVAEAEVREILAPYENRKLTLAQIYEAADKITALYRERGYIVAKAYVPAQDARNGVLRIKLVAGRYGQVTTENKSLVRDSFIERIVEQALAGSTFIHRDQIERVLLLVSDLPGVAVPRGVIGAGRQPGTSDFKVEVPAARPIDGYVTGDNYGSPLTGRNRLTGGINWNSPLGYGDRLSGFGILSHTNELVNGRLAYSAPIGSDGLRAEVAAFRTTYVLGDTFKDLDATGTADGISAMLVYPLQRRRDSSTYIFGFYAHKNLQDNIFGISFAERTSDAGSLVLGRTTNSAIAGMPLTTHSVLGITAGYLRFPDPIQKAANIAGPDTVGDFAKIGLIFEGTLALTEKVSLSVEFKGQKSLTGNLDPSEQIGLTGYWGIRSFDEGLAGDSGFVFRPELKFALPDALRYSHSVGLFADTGAVWIEDASYTTTQKERTRLSDVGIGYYGTLEYSPGRSLLLKAQVVRTVGSDGGAQSYNKRTKGLIQAGFTF